MLKLSDFRTASDLDYGYLKRTIDGYHENVPYLLDVTLPDGCDPKQSTIGFYRSGSQYITYLEKPVQYTGNNRALQRLCHDGRYAVTRWSEMVRFCRSFPDDTPLDPPQATPRRPPDEVPNESPAELAEDEITDFSAIDIQAETKVSPLTFEFIRKELKKVVIGQDFAVDCAAYLLAAHLSKPNPKRPLSLLFHGLPATGKSELAKAIGDLLAHYGVHPYSVVWTDLNTYTEAHTVHNLTGAPPSYIGHDETPVFYAVVENPYTVFIWDEIEKSHPAVLKLFMGIMDEGRAASNKELPDHTREYNFKHSIHIFTTNSPIGDLSGAKKHPIGFVTSKDIEDISYEDDAVSVEYKDKDSQADPTLIQRIYDQNEKARRALVRTGVLPEIATRFSGFAEFKPLDNTAKIRIIAKTILNTGFEYGIKLKYIAPGIIQEMAASAGKDGFSVRSYRTIAEGYLGNVFAAFAAVSGADSGLYRLEGSLTEPQLIPA